MLVLKNRCVVALCLVGLIAGPVRSARASITLGIVAGVASGVALLGSSWWWYSSSVDKAQKQLIEDSKLLYNKYTRLYAPELKFFPCKALSYVDIDMLAATLPSGPFNAFVGELSKNRATLASALAGLEQIIASKKFTNTLSRQAREQLGYLSAFCSQLDRFAEYLDLHYGYFELHKKYQVLACEYAQEIESIQKYSANDPDRAVREVQKALLNSYSDSSITYPYVMYSNAVHDDLKALDAALGAFTRTEGQPTEGPAGKLYKNSMVVHHALETVKNLVVQTLEYQTQRDLYAQAQRAQALVEVEQRKALAEEQKNNIEMQKLVELRRANALQQQSIYEQQRRAQGLAETQRLLKQSFRGVSDAEAKEKIKRIEQKLYSL